MTSASTLSARIVLVTAGVSVVTGIINLFTRTEAERRWSAYEDLRDRLTSTEATDDRAANLEARAETSAVAIDFDVSVAPQGAAVGVVGRF